MWILCLSQKAVTGERFAKRKSRVETVDPIGNDAVSSESSKQMAKKRRIAMRLGPLLTAQAN